jgi:hypothetical protein
MTKCLLYRRQNGWQQRVTMLCMLLWMYLRNILIYLGHCCSRICTHNYIGVSNKVWFSYVYTRMSTRSTKIIFLGSRAQLVALWFSAQSYWLQIQRSRFDSWCYQIFLEVVGLERGPLSLLSTTEELFERKSSGSSLEIREYGSRDPSRWLHGTPPSKSWL